MKTFRLTYVPPSRTLHSPTDDLVVNAPHVTDATLMFKAELERRYKSKADKVVWVELFERVRIPTAPYTLDEYDYKLVARYKGWRLRQKPELREKPKPYLPGPLVKKPSKDAQRLAQIKAKASQLRELARLELGPEAALKEIEDLAGSWMAWSDERIAQKEAELKGPVAVNDDEMADAVQAVLAGSGVRWSDKRIVDKEMEMRGSAGVREDKMADAVPDARESDE